MKQKKVIIINAETTGLDAKSDELLRISIISDSGTILFNEYVHPTKHTEWPAAQKIHHITSEMVANCQPLLYYLKDLKEIISDADIIVGYNHSFDMSFLAEAGVDSDPRKNYDLMLEFSQLIGEWDDTRNTYKFFSLRECADYLGYQWPTGKDHDCLEDCKAILYCYKKFAAGETGKGGLPNRSQLRASSSAPTVKFPISTMLSVFISVCALIFFAIFLPSSMTEEKVIHEIETRQDDKKLKEYKSLLNAGDIDASGYFSHGTDVTEEVSPSSGSIHVTFARNAYMEIRYFLDDTLNKEIDTKNCHLFPNDSIYIGDVSYHGLNSNTYQLSSFEIRELDNAGHVVDTISQPAKKRIALDVPNSCHEISIVPIGSFKNRMLHLNAFYYDQTGTKKSLSGVWAINDSPYDDTIGINPLNDYQVKCNFGTYAETYYFVEAQPKFQLHEEQNEVIFSPVKSTDKNLDYQVELHPYIGLSVSNPKFGPFNNDIISRIEIERYGGRINVDFKDGPTIKADQLDKLKHNDIVHITLNSTYQIIDANKNLSISKPTAGAVEGTEEYLVTIPKDNYRNLKLVVSAKNSLSTEPIIIPSIDNATVSLVYDDNRIQIIDDEAKPNENDKVILTITPDNGYYLAGKNIKQADHYTKTMKYKDYEKTIYDILNGISAKKIVTLWLVPENDYGSATYKLDREEVSGSVTAKEGQKIIIDFKVAPNSGMYIVNEKGKQKTSAKAELIVTADMDHMIIYPNTNFNVKAVNNDG